MKKNNQKKKTSVKAAVDRQKSDKDPKLRQAQLLLNISKDLAAYGILDEMLTALIEITSKEVGADRSTIFLNDSETNELYSRVAQGESIREIRILNNTGAAGHVFTTGKGIIVHDAYKDEHFDRSVDRKTGYVTKSILSVPIKTVRGEIIGVVQALNKKRGRFTKKDLTLLEAMSTQAALALQSCLASERNERSHLQEMEFFNVVSDVTAEIDLGTLLQKVMSEATKMLNAERSTLFLNDEKTDELFSKVGEGLYAAEIRFPNHLGIAGTVFTSGKTVTIPHAYADLRFNPGFDKKTGFFTRSILCVPVVNKQGKTIGVTQVLNKRGGSFTDEDESRLRAFTAQVSIALENAKLFDDVQNMKNYNESMLESMSNGVITLNEEGKIITCNAAVLKILQIPSEEMIGQDSKTFFTGTNSWMLEKIAKVDESRVPDVTMDADLEFNENRISANITFLPLISTEKERLGNMIMIEDISGEKRMKSTLSRYMDPSLTDKLLEDDENVLGGKSAVATILFSDIRSFTTLTEELGPQATVSLLNEYFTLMVDCIQGEGGMLDKFIGDAIMAAFGMPLAKGDDEDRAVRAAIAMIKSLRNWNKERLDGGKKTIDMGIGLNTDSIVSGNIGSPKRMDYTMIGDGVNLAARLESACKQYSARILISENTLKKLRGTYSVREIDWVVVKGKTEPVGIYEVLDYYTEEEFPNLMEVLNYFKHGISHYRKGAWDKAIGAFKEAFLLNKNDVLSKTYIERCQHLKKNPPKDGWKGVWIMTSK